ncbi:hypothetical protein BD769DRAFT_1081630 [Suillus cothurnatus]|nr:hypothetical protein BD769DRAFT_1081630 [Suillus cothurnatus]
MPKASKKYYAVRVGREGPRIYDSWPECNANVSRWPGAVHKSFRSRLEAEKWLALSGPILLPVSSMESMSSSGSSVPSTFEPRVARSNQTKVERQPPTLEGRDRTPVETSAPGTLIGECCSFRGAKKRASEGRARRECVLYRVCRHR